MAAPSIVIGACAACGDPEGLHVFAMPTAGPAEIVKQGDSPVIWTSPGLTKATMGAPAACGKCGAKHELRMLIVEELQLPMGFVPLDLEDTPAPAVPADDKRYKTECRSPSPVAGR